MDKLGINSLNRQISFEILDYNKDQSIVGMAADDLSLLEQIEKALDEKDKAFQMIVNGLNSLISKCLEYPEPCGNCVNCKITKRVLTVIEPLKASQE